MRISACAVLLLAACGDSTPDVPAAAFAPVAEHYASGVHALYADSLVRARELEQRAQALVAAPDEATLTAARNAWLEARVPYGQTEAFRFYDGPIDGLNGPEGQINGWPLDEAYIDYVDGKPESGIVNDPSIEITPKQLAQYNEGTLGGMFERDKAISTGYHAIEFLLWGQDRSASGPGARPASDYASATHAERRGQYLLAASALLIQDLETVTAEWAPDADNYRRAFVADPKLAVTRMFTGIALLSKRELASERMDVALQNHDQEDEHSCFSDNTHTDLVMNEVGILNVWRGQYLDKKGPSLFDLVAASDQALAKQTDFAVTKSLALLGDIPPPFDQVILDSSKEGWQTANRAINAVYDQADLLVRAADAIGIKVEVPEPQP